MSHFLHRLLGEIFTLARGLFILILCSGFHAFPFLTRPDQGHHRARPGEGVPLHPGPVAAYCTLYLSGSFTLQETFVCVALLSHFNSQQLYSNQKENTLTLKCISAAIVPYHGGGRSKKINAWYLNTLMVYL
jgi:hypothetical protein